MKDDNTVREYINTIKKEMKMVFSLIGKDRKVSQIHYGGGTPNAIDALYLKELNTYIFDSFELTEDAEVAIECNPAYLDTKYIHSLKEAGFNRYSLGIQDFNEKVLKVINRDASLMPVKKLIETLKDGDEKIKVNLDFIYGLPYQTTESFAETIKQATETGADRIVTFSYAHVPWVNKAQLILEKAGLPDSDEKMSMYEAAYKILSERDYRAIGLDHYAKENDALTKALDDKKLHRNFQGYCTTRTTGQVYAFGVSGISQFESSYIQNTKSTEDYISSIESGKFACVKGYKLSRGEKITRYIIEQIMCNKQLLFDEVSRRFDLNEKEFTEYISCHLKELQELEKDGIVVISEDSIKVNESGVLFIRNVAAAFDPLMKTAGKSFSKPV